MTTFDKRKDAYESKFARDEELKFKATARRNMTQASRPQAGPRRGVSAATVAAGAPPAPAPADVVNDPEDAYTREVKAALVEAMLESSGSLSLGAEEWLTVAASDNAPRDPLVPGDTVDFSTWVFRVKGSDLAAFRAGRISIDDARKKVEVREY